jgi:tryptophan halogenase
LGQLLKEPFRSYTDTLFCDRAVVGGWKRGANEPIKPYTVVETMNCGWAWQIDHEHHINRGYVYSSSFLSDDEAREEFLRKNPKVPADKTRVVKYRSGRYERSWVGNVVAVGNAAGFVEPLEATALQVICVEASTLADTLADSLMEPPPTLIQLYNRYNGDQWDDIRNFLAVHYRFNTRLNTPFWKACQNDVALHGAEPIVDFYRENGPSVVAGISLVHASNSFRMDGFLAMLVGQQVPHQKPYIIPPAEQEFWRRRRQQLALDAHQGMTSEQAIAALRRPDVRWG